MRVKSRLMVAFVAGLLAASATGVSAQEGDSGAAFFAVNLSPSGPPTEPEPGDSGDGWAMFIGLTQEDIVVDAGDPRASGLLASAQNGTDFELPDGRMGITLGTYRLVNDQGAWDGTGTITSRGEDGPPTHVSGWWTFSGDGAYDGLTLELHGEPLNERMEEVWWGVIYPTEATPPTPEPIPAN